VAVATCKDAVSDRPSGERLAERGLSGRAALGAVPDSPNSAGQGYIRWIFRDYYRDPQYLMRRRMVRSEQPGLAMRS
jgi:hypothetical protein